MFGGLKTISAFNSGAGISGGDILVLNEDEIALYVQAVLQLKPDIGQEGAALQAVGSAKIMQL